MNIFKKIIENCITVKSKRINLKSSKGSVSLLIIGIVAFVATCYVGIKTEPFIQKTQTGNTLKEGLANEITPSFNNQDLNKVYELGNFDPKKAVPQDLLPPPKTQEDVDKYYSLLGYKTLDAAKGYYETQILNNKSFSTKTKNLADKYLVYDSTGKWPIDMKDPSADFGPKPGESGIQQAMRWKEEEFLNRQYNFYLDVKKFKKWNEEDAPQKKIDAEDAAQLKKAELLNDIKWTIEYQQKLASEKAEIEKDGLANYWIKKLKEKMQESGILADKSIIARREDYFKSIDFISKMEKLSPPPDWLPERIADIEDTRKLLEEVDPLFSDNKLIAWLNRADRDGLKIDPETIAAILKSMGTGTTEIADETTSESNGENGWTDSAQSGESAPGSATDTAAATQPKETTPVTIAKPAETTPETATDTAQPSELNLKGTMTDLKGLVAQLTLNICLSAG